MERTDEQRQGWVDNWLADRRNECAVLFVRSVAEWLPICEQCGGENDTGSEILLDANGEMCCGEICFGRKHQAAAHEALIRQEQSEAMERAEGQ